MRMFSVLRLILTCLVLGSIAACKPGAGPNSNEPVPVRSAAAIAEIAANNVAAAHRAINNNDESAFAEKVQLPLYVRKQQWTMGERGPLDFNLLEGENKIIRTSAELKSFGLVDQFNIESPETDMVPYSIDDLTDYMEGADPIWTDLNITLYVSAQGDVEHIVLFGTDRKTGKVRAIYGN